MNIKKTLAWKLLRDTKDSLSIFYKTYIISIFTNSFAQFGDDIIIEKLLGKRKGFYIDIGANHPDRFSNTKRFYVNGWRGINIEPNPISYNKFLKRKKDVNLNIGIGGVMKC